VGGQGAQAAESEAVTRPRPAGPSLVLRLYVAGSAPNSLRALANVRTVCEEHFPSRHTLEVVDLLRQPLRGVADGIIVTPTLLKLAPLPTQRLIGDLADRDLLRLTLGGQ
jgi:circadian clock protein KaiB